MSDTKLIQAVLDKVDTLGKKVDEVRTIVIKNGERLDKLGLELAKLQDDTPTMEEFDEMDNRVKKLEKQAVNLPNLVPFISRQI